MNLSRRDVERQLKLSREALIAQAGILAMYLAAPNLGVVHAGDSIEGKALRAFPSAFTPAEISDDLGMPSHKVDLGLDLAQVGIATQLARQSTRWWELPLLAASAQLFATASDSSAEAFGLVPGRELNHLDTGSSAITTAFIIKFSSDKVFTSEPVRAKRLYAASMAIFAGAVTVGAFFVDRKNGTLDLTSHGAGLTSGLLWSKLSRNKPKTLNNDPAA